MVAAGKGSKKRPVKQKREGVHAAWNYQWPHLLHSTFKRKSSDKNGSPGGWGDRSKQKGLKFSVAIAALFCFHDQKKLPDGNQKVVLGWIETEKDSKGI